MHQDPASQEYADEVARLRASESDSDAELLVCLDIFSLYSTRFQKSSVRENLEPDRVMLNTSRIHQERHQILTVVFCRKI
jgi:hypothetical protein